MEEGGSDGEANNEWVVYSLEKNTAVWQQKRLQDRKLKGKLWFKRELISWNMLIEIIRYRKVKTSPNCQKRSSHIFFLLLFLLCGNATADEVQASAGFPQTQEYLRYLVCACVTHWANEWMNEWIPSGGMKGEDIVEVESCRGTSMLRQFQRNPTESQNQFLLRKEINSLWVCQAQGEGDGTNKYLIFGEI